MVSPGSPHPAGPALPGQSPAITSLRTPSPGPGPLVSPTTPLLPRWPQHREKWVWLSPPSPCSLGQYSVSTPGGGRGAGPAQGDRQRGPAGLTGIQRDPAPGLTLLTLIILGRQETAARLGNTHHRPRLGAGVSGGGSSRDGGDPGYMRPWPDMGTQLKSHKQQTPGP